MKLRRIKRACFLMIARVILWILRKAELSLAVRFDVKAIDIEADPPYVLIQIAGTVKGDGKRYLQAGDTLHLRLDHIDA